MTFGLLEIFGLKISDSISHEVVYKKDLLEETNQKRSKILIVSGKTPGTQDKPMVHLKKLF